MTDQMDAIELLTADHRKVDALFGQLEGTTDADERTRIVHEVVHDLAVHGEIEELLLYPRLRDAIPNGEELADEAVNEHAAIKHTLNELDRMTAHDDGFDQRMKELMAEVRHHVQEEESEVFPQLRQALGAEELRSLGEALHGAKSLVPTRPHPNAPTSPVGKLAASPPVALVDRIRDAVRRWNDQR